MNEPTDRELIESLKCALHERGKLIDWIISEAISKEKELNAEILELRNHLTILKELSREDVEI